MRFLCVTIRSHSNIHLVGHREVLRKSVDMNTPWVREIFQVNIGVAERIQQDVLTIQKGTRLSDDRFVLWGGLFTLPLAKEHGWAMGVELVDSAIKPKKLRARNPR